MGGEQMAAKPSPRSGGRRRANRPQAERLFLRGPSSRFRELCSVARFSAEFIRGFRALHFVGPCVTVFGSARFTEDHPYYTLARNVGAHLARMGFTVMTGGGPGIMEAAKRGAAEAGGKTIGLGIELPHEQRLNRYISAGLDFNFHYFFMRKLWFAQIAKALIVFPGGFGTMDELWEMMTLSQTGKLGRHHLILIYGRRYWDRVLNWRHMIQSGTIDEREYGVLEFADTVDEAFERVKAGLVKFHLQLDRDWPL
jgi:uncharacterized protein (TIGR00730 family)